MDCYDESDESFSLTLSAGGRGGRTLRSDAQRSFTRRDSSQSRRRLSVQNFQAEGRGRVVVSLLHETSPLNNAKVIKIIKKRCCGAYKTIFLWSDKARHKAKKNNSR
jgi:hypothetical protein